MTDREAMQMALDAMLHFPGDISDEMFESIRSLKAALAKPEPEPVVEPVEVANGWTLREVLFEDGEPIAHREPPTRRPLTDEEIDKATTQERDALLDHIYEYGTAAEGVLGRVRKLSRSIERAHGIEEAK